MVYPVKLWNVDAPFKLRSYQRFHFLITDKWLQEKLIKYWMLPSFFFFFLVTLQDFKL